MRKLELWNIVVEIKGYKTNTTFKGFQQNT